MIVRSRSSSEMSEKSVLETTVSKSASGSNSAQDSFSNAEPPTKLKKKVDSKKKLVLFCSHIFINDRVDSVLFLCIYRWQYFVILCGTYGGGSLIRP
ncbi:hypothetical protein WUBG_17314 [Wuchereria bancrofti]|uniref:Uncharacterized protein n=1 Tax=Wuchereria bancrofti TaxID=6293 RepID=J9ACQ3_WUCBA|nr:hypothetical protein WUBG_17314 [Wuchereria bancrofti]